MHCLKICMNCKDFLVLKETKANTKERNKVSSKVLHKIYLKFIEVTKIIELAVYLKISVCFSDNIQFSSCNITFFTSTKQCFKLHIKYCKFTVGKPWGNNK